VVEAGLYVTAGTKVSLVEGGEISELKAKDLSGQPGLLFRRNSQSGAVEVIPRPGVGVELNSELHA
jgi:2,3,4,5-tetrahydropyridine-2-carboxylate N-succinyltransferase